MFVRENSLVFVRKGSLESVRECSLESGRLMNARVIVRNPVELVRNSENQMKATARWTVCFACNTFSESVAPVA